MIKSGRDLKEIVFLISDNQIKKGFILEDLNNMLNSGDIP
jgi:dynein heavy chain, axonemal